MKTEHKLHELELFTQRWPLQTPYLIWGASNTAKYFCGCLDNRLLIDGFIDNDTQKWGMEFLGKTVFSWEECKKAFPNHKIIVASLAYPEIRTVLREYGRKELEDFCDSRYFLSAHAVTYGNKLYLARTDISVTEYCNLRCKKRWKIQNNYFSAIIFRFIGIIFSQRQYLITIKFVLNFV